MVDTVRVTALESQVVLSGTSDESSVRTTAIEAQTLESGLSDESSVRTTAIETQVLHTMFNKTCVITVSC